jgi:diketogulonate reductase-like aldo/keto reductase
MPLLGASMHALKGICAAEVVRETLQANYRLIDTARVLRNEDHIGGAIKVTDIHTRPSL